MTSQGHSRRTALIGRVSAGAAISAFCIGCLVLAGWIFDLAVLKSLRPDLVSMKANTAVAFMLTGISLWLSQAKRIHFRPGRIVARVCATVVAAVGLLSLAEYAFGWNLQIDQLLFKEIRGAVQSFYPGRMAPNTALNFLLIGLSLLLLDVQTRHGYRPALFLTGLGGTITLVALIGYVYGETRLYSPSLGATAMSVPAVLAGLASFLGLFLARPGPGLLAILTSENSGSVMARRFLLPVLLAPILVDVVLLAGERSGLYGDRLASAAHVALITVIFLGLVIAVAASMNQAEAELEAIRRAQDRPWSPPVSAPVDRERRKLGYGLAVLIVAAAALLRLGFLQILGARNIYVTFYPAVMLAALYGGLPAGLLATALSALLVSYIWVGSRSLVIHDPADWLSLAIFLVGGMMISAISEAMHRARARAHEAETQSRLVAAQQRERETRLRLAAIVESSPDAIISESPDGTILTWNAGAERMFGYRGEEIIDQPITRLLPPERVETEEPVVRRLQRGERVESLETVCITKDGRQLDVSLTSSLLTNSEGQVIGASKIVRDITVRKRMEDDLRRARDQLELRVQERTAELIRTNEALQAEILERQRMEEELRLANAYNRNLIEVSLDPLVTIGPAGKITDVNAATEAATGRSRAELIGTDFSEYFTEPERARAGYEQVFRENLVRDYALDLRHRDGHIMSVLYNASVYRDERGNVAGVFATARDVTQRKQAEMELEKYRHHLEELVKQRTSQLEAANAQLEAEISERKRAEQALQYKSDELARSNEELEQYAYVASHDLQEPLRMVSSYVQLLARRYRGQLDSDADDFIHFAVDGSLRMQRLINDLLAYSRVGSRAKEFGNVSLDSALAQALENLKIAIQDNGAVITHESLPRVRGDGMQLAQLFQNLIENAIKFHGHQPPCIHVSAELKEDECICSIRDNGIGIPPEHLEKVFALFVRLQSRREYPGTGIGLAICKRIVERHGGRIWVESKPGEGSTFYFTVASKCEEEEQ